MQVDEFCDLINQCKAEASKRLIGQNELIENILMAFIAQGHVLLEGVPGLAKTLTVKTIAEILGLDFKRIQFTPDLLPADLIGTLIYEQNKGEFAVRKGPLFCNVILADEINRAPAKVQSAMLESMEEKQVTIGDKTYELPKPYFVLATQNPVEQEGTYNLPEAQLDRFLMKLIIDYPSCSDEIKIVQSQGNASKISVNKIINSTQILQMQELASSVVCDEKLVEYIVSILNVTRNNNKNNFVQSNDITNFIQFGASPRSGIAMILCAKIKALFRGRNFVLPEDIKSVTPNILRHRLILSYEAIANNISAENIINKILEVVPLP